jgi:PAS domain S-box-containing protein
MPPSDPAYLIAESIPHLVWVADPKGATQYINRRWQAYTGVSVEQAMGWDWQTAIHPDDVPRTLVLWRECVRTGQPYEAEFRLRRADGEYRWHIDRALPLRDAQGHIIHWFGTCTEVEDQKRAEEALRASEARFRALIEKSFDAILLLAADGAVAYASPSTARVLGFAPEELLGRDAFELVHPEDRGPTVALFAQLRTTPGGSVTSTHRARRRDGTWRWLDVRGTNLLADPGVRAVVINYQDITERVRLEQQFLQAQKMEAVGRLAAGIAHDFNNLLTVINGYAGMLLEDLGECAPGVPSVRAIREAGERAAGLTQQLLAFGRKQIAAPRLLDLNAVVRGLGRMLRRLIGEDILLTEDLQPGLGRVRADPTQLQQAVLNLAVNARDAMPRGGRLSVVTREAERDEGGRWVALAVTDTGCGMAEEVKAHLFEPFFTTKAPGQGTGLGLSTVYGIVKQSGGHVEVESQPGAGTTFTIYLPRVEGSGEAETSAGPPAVPPGHETVLLAEDEQAVRSLARQVLLSGGYTVLEAGDGAQALWLAERHGGPIHLLVTDVVMPGLGGRGLAERLCAARPGLKVLYLSGYTDDAVVRHGVSREAVHFLPKPFSAAALALKVREVLDGPPRAEPMPPAPR